MENPTVFELSQAVQQWRAQMTASSAAMQGADLDELEVHLLDSVQVLQTRGLSTEEAFLIAARRVGDAGTLGAEYSKVNPAAVWHERVTWMLAGMLAIHLAGKFIGVVSDLEIFCNKFVGLNTPSMAWVDLGGRLLTMCGLIWGLQRMAAGRVTQVNRIKQWLSQRRRPAFWLWVLIIGFELIAVTMFGVTRKYNLYPYQFENQSQTWMWLSLLVRVLPTAWLIYWWSATIRHPQAAKSKVLLAKNQ